MALPLYSQGTEVDPEAQAREEELEERIQLFMDDFTQLANACDQHIRMSESTIESGTYTHILREKLNVLNTGLQSVDYRWNAFTQLEQPDIADSEQLMELMTQVQNLRKAVADSISAQQRKCDAIADFLTAERFILAQDSVYSKLYRKAHALSKFQETALQLEKVKAQEQAVFTRLQDCYNKCKTAAAMVPQLRTRAAVLEERYYSLKTIDEKIQAMVYQPLIMRIKDYLLGVACVAVILIFLNMLITKLQAVKKARQMVKKQKEMLDKTRGGGYPTI